MKKLLTIVLLFAGIAVAQEFSVEGDLSVSGLIVNSTIDSLQTEIQTLEARIDSMALNSSDVVVKFYDVFLTNRTTYHNMPDITGEDADWYLVQVVSLNLGRDKP